MDRPLLGFTTFIGNNEILGTSCRRPNTFSVGTTGRETLTCTLKQMRCSRFLFHSKSYISFYIELLIFPSFKLDLLSSLAFPVQKRVYSIQLEPAISLPIYSISLQEPRLKHQI